MSRLHFRHAFALILAAMLLMPSVVAKDANWDALFESLDADRAYRVIRGAVEKEDTASASRLFQAGLRARHMHLAIGVGDALREIGTAWVASDDFDKAVAVALRDRAEDHQVNLARILGALGHEKSGPALAALAGKRRSERVVVEALLMSGALTVFYERPFPAVQKVLVKGLKSRKPDVRRAAVTAIGRGRFEGHVKALLDLAQRDKDRWVSIHAVRALERLEYDGGIAAFGASALRRGKDRGRHARLKAVVCLAGPMDVPVLLDLMKSRDVDTRMAGVLACGRVLRPAVYSVSAKPGPPLPSEPRTELSEALLGVMFKGRVGFTRSAARAALEAMGAEARGVVEQAALKHLGDSDESARFQAVRLCASFELKTAFEPLFSMCLGAESPAERMLAARALEAVDADVGLERLAAVLSARRTKAAQREYAVHALAYIRRRRALEMLVAQLEVEKPSAALVVACQLALERATGHGFGRDPQPWRQFLGSVKDPFRRESFLPSSRAQRGAVRNEGLYRFKPESDRAIERGLQYLERQQEPHGLWLLRERAVSGSVLLDYPNTMHCVLAFSGAGYRTDRGRYRETLWRATEFLAATQQFDGTIPDPEVALSVAMERRRLVTSLDLNAFVLGYLAGRSPALRPAAQRLVDVVRFDRADSILDRWSGSGSTWFRGRIAHAADVALARGAGLWGDFGWVADHLELELRDRSSDVTAIAEQLEDSSNDPAYNVGKAQHHHTFTHGNSLPDRVRLERAYIADGSDYWTTRGAWGRIAAGMPRSHPFLIGSANYMLRKPPLPAGVGLSGRTPYWASFEWKAADVMFQIGGRFWRSWSAKLQRELLPRQVLTPPASHGSWPPFRRSSGALNSTATAVLSLESFFRFPPWCAEKR